MDYRLAPLWAAPRLVITPKVHPMDGNKGGREHSNDKHIVHEHGLTGPLSHEARMRRPTGAFFLARARLKAGSTWMRSPLSLMKTAYAHEGMAGRAGAKVHEFEIRSALPVAFEACGARSRKNPQTSPVREALPFGGQCKPETTPISCRPDFPLA